MSTAHGPLACAVRERPRAWMFDIPFDALTFEQAVEALIRLAEGDAASYAVTANVDHVVRFARRPEVRPLYLRADLVLADGMPLIWASKLLGTDLPERVAGSDLLPALCARAAERRLSVFLMGGAPGTAERAAAVLVERCPGLCIAGTYCPPLGFEKDPVQAARALEAVRSARPDILFVGLGSPKQECWIAENRAACGAPLSLGVGVSFSFMCGDVKRAPRWLQRLGLEWAHRLCQEPGRLWKRYLIEDSVFAWLLLRDWLRRGPRRQPQAGGRNGEPEAEASPLRMSGGCESDEVVRGSSHAS